MIKEHMLNIKKIFKLSFIDLKKIYKGAALGWFWIIAKPAVTIFMYWFLFEIGMKVGKPINNIPYVLWLITGLLPWFYISDIISTLPGSYRKYSYLVNKVKFPVSIIPTFMSLSRFLVNIVLTIIVIFMYILILKKYDIYYMTLIFYMIFMFLFQTVVGSIIALVSSVSKDIGSLIKTIQTPLLFLSTIFWSVDSVNIKLIKNIQIFNPISYFANGYKDAFIYKIHFYDKPKEFIIMFILFISIMYLNKFLYKKISKSMPDYL